MLQLLTFSFLNPLISRNEDNGTIALLENIQDSVKIDNFAGEQHLRAAWQVQSKTPNPSLRKALWHTYKADLLRAALCKLLWSALIVTCECLSDETKMRTWQHVSEGGATNGKNVGRF